MAFRGISAESEGFEPPEQLPVHRISSAARSTTPATFLDWTKKHDNHCLEYEPLTIAGSPEKFRKT